MDDRELEVRFTYHPPEGTQPEVYAKIRTMARDAADYVNLVAEGGREKSLAITKLEEFVMWANAAVARGGKRDQRIGPA